MHGGRIVPDDRKKKGGRVAEICRVRRTSSRRRQRRSLISIQLEKEDGRFQSVTPELPPIEKNHLYRGLIKKEKGSARNIAGGQDRSQSGEGE